MRLVWLKPRAAAAWLGEGSRRPASVTIEGWGLQCACVLSRQRKAKQKDITAAQSWLPKAATSISCCYAPIIVVIVRVDCCVLSSRLCRRLFSVLLACHHHIECC